MQENTNTNQILCLMHRSGCQKMYPSSIEIWPVQRPESDPYDFLGLLDLNSHPIVLCHKAHEQLPRSLQIALLVFFVQGDSSSIVRNMISRNSSLPSCNLLHKVQQRTIVWSTMTSDAWKLSGYLWMWSGEIKHAFRMRKPWSERAHFSCELFLYEEALAENKKYKYSDTQVKDRHAHFCLLSESPSCLFLRLVRADVTCSVYVLEKIHTCYYK